MKIVIAALLLIQPFSSQGAEPLKPLGKWNVSYENASCVLSRDFGEASFPITLQFEPAPLGIDMNLSTMRAAASKIDYREVTGKVALQPSGKEIANNIKVGGAVINGQSKKIESATAENVSISDFRGADAISIEYDTDSRQLFVLGGQEKGVRSPIRLPNGLIQTMGIRPARARPDEDSAEKNRRREVVRCR